MIQTEMTIFTSKMTIFTGNIESLYAFSYQQNCDYAKDHGWDLFDTQSEYMRMGAPNENWVLSNINKEYEVSTLRYFKWRYAQFSLQNLGCICYIFP